MEIQATGRRPGSSRRAFTLVEILIAFAVLVIFSVGVFTLLSRFSKAGSLGQWRSATNGQMRKAQERVRQQIESASYPMKITPQSNAISDLPSNYVIVNPDGSGSPSDNTTAIVRVFGPGEDTAEPSAEDVILQLVKSKPGREGLGGTGGYSDKEVEATQVKLLLKKSQKVFAGKYKWCRTLFVTEDYKSMPTAAFTSSTPFDFGGAKHSETLLVNDVNRVRVSVQKDVLQGGGTATPNPAIVEVEISCIEPAAGQAEIVSRVKAQPNAGIELK